MLARNRIFSGHDDFVLSLGEGNEGQGERSYRDFHFNRYDSGGDRLSCHHGSGTIGHLPWYAPAMLSLVVFAAATMAAPPGNPFRIPAAFVGRSVINNPTISEKVIALTFDDGPSPLTTPRVLAALKKYKASSTFFIVGGMAKNRAKILRQMVREGHVVGNHTYSHPYHPDKEKAAIEIKTTNQVIHAAIGVYPTIFRPPGGFMDSWTARLSKASGLASVFWTGSSGDTATKSEDVVYSNVIRSAHPGAIILMHDVKEHTTRAVPRILKTLKKNGYRFVTVPEMLNIWEKSREASNKKLVAARSDGRKSKSG